MLSDWPGNKKVHEDYSGGKSVVVIARQSGLSHSTIAVILKNKNKVTETVKGSASLRAVRSTKVWEGPISNMEKLLMTRTEDQTQKYMPLSTMKMVSKTKSLFACWKKRWDPTTVFTLLQALGGLNNSRIVIQYIMWKWVVSLWVLMWKQLKNFWKLIV